MSAAGRMFMLGQGFAAGLFLLGTALHWYNTPHPDASQARAIAVGVQALVGALASIFAYVRARQANAFGTQAPPQ